MLFSELQITGASNHVCSFTNEVSDECMEQVSLVTSGLFLGATWSMESVKPIEGRIIRTHTNTNTDLPILTVRRIIQIHGVLRQMRANVA